MNLDRQAKSTLTPIELNIGDTLCFVDGTTTWTMRLKETAARVVERATPPHFCREHYRDDIRVYGMTAVVDINDREYVMERLVGGQESFYEPWVIDGVRIWFDAAAAAFIHPPRAGGIIHEKDWAHRQICSPSRAARFAVQSAGRPIAPEPVGNWFDGQKAVPDIAECYMGSDCWMGPYNGGAAHCGLDINMPKGTHLLAPFTLDDQYMFSDARSGSLCGRWRGTRRWNDGSKWVIQSHHMVTLLVPERTPVTRGTVYGTGAGTGVGLREHSHFMFRVIEQGGDYMLDPWILFWAVGK